ncbi:MAG: protein kinase [Prevotellaceae bacterium]|jgi:serine/threonine protein kinase/TPR repeat protein|nr:protein kinase [Prevotellaceae bacterium]
MQLQENTLFHSRYRLIRLLGRGGFSEVWLAEDSRTGIKVALKVYAPGTGLDDDGIQLFSHEFSLVFNFNHGNLLRPSHFDVCERRPYLIMPFCERGSAAKLTGNISEAEAWKFLHDVAAGLAYLHEQEPDPVIHQDIKPDNVLIDGGGHYLITDFGISSKARSTLRKSVGKQTSGGTIAYMSPERFGRDNMPVKASDVWALGATVFELLTGDTPFGNHGGLIQKGGAEIPAVSGNWSDDLKTLVEKCLALNAWDRPMAKQIVEWKKDREHSTTQNHSRHDSSMDTDIDKNVPDNKGKSNRLKKSVIIAATVIVGIVSFFLIRHNYNHKHYTANIAKAESFYAVARYDSALVYFGNALKYVDTDTVRHKQEMLNYLIPALNDFYAAKYKQSFEKFQIAAEMGSGDAYYYLGELTYNGLATAKDYNKGWEYTQKAFQKGFKMAYWRMANACETGHGVPQDKDKADKYYFEAIEGIKKLAENGDPEALGNLGSMYSVGQGVSKNEKMAFEYCLKSAQAGYAFVMNALALYYKVGYGTKQNNGEAMKWYIKSAEMGNPGSLLDLGNIYLYGYCDQTANKKKGVELITKAAEQNYAPALRKLGYLYAEGDYVKQDNDKGFEYSLKATEYDNDDFIAMENVAFLYKQGAGTEKNYAKSKQYYLNALRADTGRIDNYIYIGRLYKEGGPNLAKNTDEYIKYCELAVQKGSAEAKTELGNYFNGLGYDAFTKRNYSQARNYFNRAVVRYGHKTAKDNLDFINKLGL